MKAKDVCTNRSPALRKGAWPPSHRGLLDCQEELLPLSPGEVVRLSHLEFTEAPNEKLPEAPMTWCFLELKLLQEAAVVAA